MRTFTEILGASAPSGLQTLASAERRGALWDAARVFVPPLAMGAAGAYLWRDHRWLGFFAGAAVPDAVSVATGRAFLPGPALARVANTAALVGGSLLWKKHPFLGGVAGLLGGGLVTGALFRRQTVV